MSSDEYPPDWTFRSHWMSYVAGHARVRPTGVALKHRGRETTWKELH